MDTSSPGTGDDDASREPRVEAEDGLLLLEGETVSKWPRLRAARWLLAFHRRNGADADSTPWTSDDE